MRQIDKEGNDKADEVADEGVKVHGEDVVQTGGLLTRRHRLFTSFLKQLHDHVIERRYLEEKKEQEEKQSGKEGQWKDHEKKEHFVNFYMPSYLVGVKLQKFEVEGTLEHFRELGSKAGNAEQLLGFLNRCIIQECKEGEEGTTWIELYLLYRYCGGEDGIKLPNNSATKRASMRQQVYNFKKMTKEVARRVLSKEDEKLFRPNLSKKPRLRGYGILTHMALVNFKVVITEKIRTQMAKDIMRSQNGRTNKEVEEVMKGSRLVKLQPFINVGRSGWTRSLETQREEVFSGEGKKKTLQEAAMAGVEELVAKLRAEVGEERMKKPKRLSVSSAALPATRKQRPAGKHLTAAT